MAADNNCDAATECDVRQLRNNIYGLPDDADPAKRAITDRAWATVKDNWMTPENVRWLIEHQPQVL